MDIITDIKTLKQGKGKMFLKGQVFFKEQQMKRENGGEKLLSGEGGWEGGEVVEQDGVIPIHSPRYALQ